MPIIKSAKKAARQADKRTEHNAEIKKAIKAAIKEFKKNPSAANLSKAQSEIDKALKKDLIKRNTASRRKANLSKIAKAAGVKLNTVKKAAETTKKAATKPAAKTAKPAKATTTKPAAKATATKKAAAKKTQSKATAPKK